MPRRRAGYASPPRTRLPARPPPSMPAPVAPPQPRQPGLMGQMAATAGGVAVGHVVGSAITGALSGGESTAQQQSDIAPQSNIQQNPCQYQIDELIRCTQTQHDITLCTGFSDALKECTRSYGMYHGQQ